MWARAVHLGLRAAARGRRGFTSKADPQVEVQAGVGAGRKAAQAPPVTHTLRLIPPHLAPREVAGSRAS